MKNRSAIVFIAIFVLIVGVSGCVEDTQNATNGQTLQQNTSDNNAASANVKISSEEAKNIAKTYINQSGATPGEPMFKADDKKYIVPIIVNGNPKGEIIIDAQTGENLGSI